MSTIVATEFFLNGNPIDADSCRQRFLEAALSRGMDEEEAMDLWEQAQADCWDGARARDALLGFDVEIVLH